MKEIGIIGAGGFAREVLWLLEDMDAACRFAGFFESDDAWTERDVSGFPVLPLSRLNPSRVEAVVAVGSPDARRKIVAALPGGTRFPTLVHPSVRMSRHVSLGEGTVVCAGTILTCDIVVGAHVQLNLGTTIGHDCELRDYVTTAPAVNVSGRCVLEERAYLGTNVCVREGIRIAPGVTVGMGAVVVAHLDRPGTYVGNPARLLQKA